MTVIDIRTFFTGYVLSILLCVIVMISLWWQNRKRSPEIALWLVDYILQFIALLFITFRGILPDFLTIVLANLLIIGGTVVLYIGLGRYVGKESRQLHNYVMLAVFTLAHVYLTYIYPDIELRLVNLSLALIYICAQCSWLMLRRVDPGLRPATRATGIVFAVFCLVSFVQIVVNLTIPKVNNIFVSGSFGVVAVLMYQILFIALTFALFLLVSRRLSTDLESELYQRTLTEEELRQSEEKFAKSFQTSPYAIAITRLENGKFIEVNDAFATITGYSRAEVMAESSIGLKLWVNEEDRKEMVSVLRKGLPVAGQEFLFRKKNGEVFTGLFSAHTIQLSQELCLLSSIDDITERKQAESDLKKSLQILRETGAMAKIGGWELDVSTKDQVWTEEVYRIHEVDMNYKPTASKGIDFYEPASRPVIELAVQRAIEYGEPFDLELEIITAKGNLRWVHAVGKADQEHGKLVGTFQDITERKRIEEQIHRNETRLMSLLNIMQHRTKTMQEFLDYALDEVIKLTDSKIGYIYFYHEDRRQFVLNTWSKDVMKECTIANPQTCYELEKTGIWGEAVRQRKPIILNDFKASHPLKKGYPEGHAHLTNFMTVPLFKEDQIVAVVGVANKASDYDETDMLQLNLFMDAVWKSVDIKKNEEMLRESEERISAITNSANDAITMMDNNGNISYWNPAAQRILGYTSAEAMGKNLHELIVPERFLPAHLAAFPEFQKTGRGNAIGKTMEVAARRKDGHEIDVALSLSAVNIKGAWHSVGIIQDITERKRGEEALRQSENFLNTLLNSIPIPVFYKDREGRYLGFNRAYENFFGATIEQLIGKSVFDISPPEFAKIYHAKDNELFENGGEQEYESQVINTLGATRDVIFNKAVFTDSSGAVNGLIGAVLDITERKKAEEQIKHMATHDLLTDLPSLRLAKDRLSSALNIARRYKKAAAVMFIDLDGFKTVNDTLGHDAGDYVLKEVAQRMISCVRETDTVARVGGDEFLIIATEINAAENASQIAEKVIQLVSRPVIFNGQQAIVGASIGIALFPGDSEDMDQLIKQADEAMYRVKNAGKNGFRFVNSALI